MTHQLIPYQTIGLGHDSVWSTLVFVWQTFASIHCQALHDSIMAQKAVVSQSLLPSLDSRGKGLLDITEVRQVG
jgi:hypothetical protein